MSSENATKGGAKAWSDAEKVALLFAIIEGQSGGSIDWKNVKLPEGRTQKACTHVIEKLKKTAKDFNGAEGPTTPSATKASSNKRKKAGDDEEGEPEVKQPRPKRGKKADLVIKTDLIEKEEPEEDE